MRIMGSIYARAMKVRIWLGEETRSTKGALDKFELLASHEGRTCTKGALEEILSLLHLP